jgi:hypothetical protein
VRNTSGRAGLNPDMRLRFRTDMNTPPPQEHIYPYRIFSIPIWINTSGELSTSAGRHSRVGMPSPASWPANGWSCCAISAGTSPSRRDERRRRGGIRHDRARLMSCSPKLHLIANVAPAQTLSQHRRNERIQADAFAIRAPVSGLLHHSLGHDRRQNFGPARGTSHCCSVTWGYRAGISRVSPHICAILNQLHEPRMERQT